MPSDIAHPLRVLHVFRAPVGGLFRHVMDVARLQAEQGIEVGLIADSTTGGERAERQLAEMAALLKLGVFRVPMSRNPGLGDWSALRRIGAHVRTVRPHIVHGHGAKGGLYARLPSVLARRDYLSAYTPHGGSLNYFPGSWAHAFYMKMERLLERGTGLFLFESQFVCDRYRAFVGDTRRPVQVFLNGLHPQEFEPVRHDADAADFMFIGELRYAKGIDVMLEALVRLRNAIGRPVTLNIIGSGPDEQSLKGLVAKLGLTSEVAFLGVKGAREAFQCGKVMLVPSRFESMPYVVLEAAGCGQPLISTRVGGIPEIFAADSDALVEPGEVDALEAAMRDALGEGEGALLARTQRLRNRVMVEFSARKMTDTVVSAYRGALLANKGDATATTVHSAEASLSNS
jgi:glycosyltransferase involved in cell wall biosynthesis